MTTFRDVMEVDQVERLNNSRNGNPRYQFHFANGMKWKTPSDAGWVYGIVPGRFENAVAKVIGKVTKDGDLKIERVEEVTACDLYSNLLGGDVVVEEKLRDFISRHPSHRWKRHNSH